MIDLRSSTLLYLPLQIRMPDDIREESIEFFDSLDDSLWSPNLFRNSYFLTLYTREAKESVMEGNHDGLRWMMNKTPKSFRIWIEDVLMPLFDPFGRVALIKSLPGESMNIHVDAGRQYFEQVRMEPKFRYVLDGALDELYFETTHGHIRTSPCSPAYIMDGAWPHWATNKNAKHRYVLGIGRPWLGETNAMLSNLIDVSLHNMGMHAIDRARMKRTKDIYELYTNV